MALFGFWKKRAAEERAAASSDGNPREIEFTSDGRGAELLIAALGGSGKVTTETAMQIPAVARCVHMVAQAAAMLPVKMYRKGDNGIEEITDDRRVEMLNGDTGDSIPGAYMRYRWVRDVLLTGAAYGFIEREHGVPARIFYVPPEEVGVVRNADSVIHKDYRFSVRGKMYYPFEFLKILRCSDGFGKGMGLVAENPLVLDTAYSLFKFQRNQLAKGGAKKGFLQTDKHVSDKTMDELREKWRKLYSNEDSENVMFLNEGVGFKEISNSAVEMQVNQSTRTVNDEILRLFGSEDGMLTAETVKNAVMPVLDMIETAFDNDLLLESEKGRVYFAFDTKELTRGDIGTRFAAYATALNEGFMQIDEVRAQEDLPPTDMKFMKLNQADVLYDPETKRIYVLNSNKWFSFGEGEISEGGQEMTAPEIEAENELRYNENHDPQNGQFTSGDGGSAGNSKKRLDKSEKSDTMDNKAKQKLLQDAINSGRISTKLDKTAQSKHVKNSDSYNSEVAKGELPSYMTISKMEVQTLVNQNYQNGDVKIGKDGQFRVIIEVDKPIGMFGDSLTHKYIETNRATIHFSKKGSHVVPAYKKEKNDNGKD